MQIELTSLDHYAQELGFDTERVSDTQLNVSLLHNTVLTFKNILEENDNAFGFLTTPWHSYDELHCFVSSGEIREYE